MFTCIVITYSRVQISREVANPVHGQLCCVFRSPGALTFGYGCTVHIGVDVGAGDAEVDVIYIPFIMSVQYIHRVLGTVQ